MQRSFAQYTRFASQMVSGFRARHEQMVADWRERDLEPFRVPGQALQVLDLANGRLRPQYMLLKAAGHRVYGVDLVNRPGMSWADLAYPFARQINVRKLGVAAEAASPRTLMCGNVGALPCADEQFDLVTSVAAFEHFLEVPRVVAELHRVLRPGALAWICIHLFTSPSGGHNVSFTEIPLRRIPHGIDPWDHLRRRRLPFVVPLNEWRSAQFLAAFAQHFDIVKHYCAMREGEEFLTPEIQEELSEYSRDELTCGAYVIVARKRS